jgi:hypothetical protein
MTDLFAGHVVSQWLQYRDTVLPLLPHLDSQGLLLVVWELRITRTENGIVGAWAHLPRELQTQREALLYHVTDWYEHKTDEPWPIETDRPPSVDDASFAGFLDKI